MDQAEASPMKTPLGLMALIALQAVCGLFFLADIISDYGEIGVGIVSDLFEDLQLLQVAHVLRQNHVAPAGQVGAGHRPGERPQQIVELPL